MTGNPASCRQGPRRPFVASFAPSAASSLNSSSYSSSSSSFSSSTTRPLPMPCNKHYAATVQQRTPRPSCSAKRNHQRHPAMRRDTRRRQGALRLQRGIVEYPNKGLELIETIRNIKQQDSLDSCTLVETGDEKVRVTLDTERCSGGCFLEGEVTATLRLRCTRCSTSFFHPVQSTFRIWANHKIKSLEECMDVDELPFPPSAGYLDITQSVAMAIQQGLPRLQVCGQSECVSSIVSGLGGTDQVGWSSPPEPHSNAFSCLQSLRQSLPDVR